MFGLGVIVLLFSVGVSLAMTNNGYSLKRERELHMQNLEAYKVPILCAYAKKGIPTVDLSIYPVENGHPIGRVEHFHTDEDGRVTLSLAPGEYGLEAYKDGANGYHGYREFTVGSTQQKQVTVAMKPNSDHSKYMDLNPTYESMVSTDDCLPIKVVSSVPGTVGEEDPPIFLKERTLTKEDWTPVDLKKLDPATRSLLKEHMNQVHSRNSSKRTDNSLGTMDVGDTIWFSPNYFGVVEEEIIYERIWHPLVLIDSEEGLTHQFDLGYLKKRRFQLPRQWNTLASPLVEHTQKQIQ